MKKRRIERDSLRERERQARAQMSSQESDLQPMFRPPVKVQPAASDRTTQQIQQRLGDFSVVKHLLDDPKSSIGVYNEPPSPAPGGPSRSSVFKKPDHTSSQNGRPQQRMPNYQNKYPDGLSHSLPKRPLPKLYNEKTPPNGGDSGEIYNDNKPCFVESILKEMKSLPLTPVTEIAATPRKEVETFNIKGLTPQRPNETIAGLETKGITHQPKNYVDRHPNPRLSTDLKKDLQLTDSEDEARKRMHSDPVTQSAPASSSGSDTTPSDSDSESSSDDSKHNGNGSRPASPPRPEREEAPEVVEGPGETPAVPHRSTWSLRNFVPQIPGTSNISRLSPRNNNRSSPVRNFKLSPRRTSPNRVLKTSPRPTVQSSPRVARSSPRCAAKLSPRNNRFAENKLSISSTAPGSNTSSSSNNSINNAESDGDSDSTKEVEIFLAETKGRTAETLLSSLSDSEDGHASGNGNPTPTRPVIPGSENAVNRVGSRIIARRSSRTSVRRPPTSSPSASDDEPPPRPPRPDPEKRKGRGRPRKLRTEEDSVKRKRGRPPKPKSIPRPPPSSSDDEHPPSSPSVPTQWQYSDSEVECPTGATDKKKNDILGKLFCPIGGGKGGGKGGAKGGKGKGQVVIVETAKDDDILQRHLKEEEAYNKRLKEEEKKREEALLRKQKEDDLKRMKEEEALKRRAKEEANQKKLKEEALRRKNQDEALQKRLREEEILQRRREEEIIQKRLRDEQMAQRRKEEEISLQRKTKEEAHFRRFKEEEPVMRRIKDVESSPRRIKDEDVLQRRIREDEISQRRMKYDEGVEMIGSQHSLDTLRLMIHVDMRRLSAECADRLIRSARPLKRLPPPPPAPPDKRQRISVENPELTPTNHERLENAEHCRTIPPQIMYFSYLEKNHQDSSDDERDHKHYLTEAKRLRADAERETDLLRKVMLYQESVLCFVQTGRVLESELDTKKAFTMYRDTLDYIKYIHSMPGRNTASPAASLAKLDILSYRCQALLCSRMFKMYKKEVKEYNRIILEYQQKPPQICVEPVGTVSPLSPTPSPASSVGSVGSAGSGSGSSGYGSGSCGISTVTPQNTPGSTHTVATASCVAIPANVYTAMTQLVKYYTFLHKSHELWDQADALIRDTHGTDLFIRVDKVCGPLTLHSSFRHLVKYVRYAITLLKSLGRHNT